MSRTFTILGCGSSMGVPRPALGWGACDPTNPKNRRRRTSLLVRQTGPGGTTTLLVDTSPDLREQLLDAEVDWLDGVLLTHPHADHTHGIDDLRPLFLKNRRRLEVFMDEPTTKDVTARFAYCFRSPPGSDYPPIMADRPLAAGQPLTIAGQGGPIEVMPIAQQHGNIPSLGFRFGGLAYSCDLNGMPPESAAALAGLDVWIVDALRYTPHPSHFCLADALAWIERVRPKRAVLTNLHCDLDYDTLSRELPPHVEPGFDGMNLSLDRT